MVEKPPTGPVILGMNSGGVEVTSRLRELPLGQWRTIRVPLRCFAQAGADLSRIDTPFRLSTEGELALRFADLELAPAREGQTSCPPGRN